MSKRLSRPIIVAAHEAGIMGVRAGARSDHRFIGVWPIVVEGRLFARSWTSKPDGWHHAFLDDPLGVIQVGGREIRIRAVRVKSERLRDAIQDAYAVKYDTKASQKYVRGFPNPQAPRYHDRVRATINRYVDRIRYRARRHARGWPHHHRNACCSAVFCRRRHRTAELDAIALEVLKKHGARSAPALVYGFPGTVIISVNDEIVHGIPGKRRLREGDLVSLDVTIEKNGFIADAARSVIVGLGSKTAERLVDVATRALVRALAVACAGVKVNAIGRAVQAEVHRHGFSVVRGLCGHGVGRTIHEQPQVQTSTIGRSATC